MKLITAHRILISAGIAFFIFYAIVQLRLYVSTNAVLALAQSIISAAIALGFALYYRTLRRWGRW